MTMEEYTLWSASICKTCWDVDSRKAVVRRGKEFRQACTDFHSTLKKAAIDSVRKKGESDQMVGSRLISEGIYRIEIYPWSIDLERPYRMHRGRKSRLLVPDVVKVCTFCLKLVHLDHDHDADVMGVRCEHSCAPLGIEACFGCQDHAYDWSDDDW